ncbi:Autophagy-related protein 17 [Elasticomyces elasticus]|nr:Autophagy-related protein 17 [Elasticomyces elasticus]
MASMAYSPSPPASTSPSASASPNSSMHNPPTVERLVSHFLSAKRSLSSISYVRRANDMVTNARALIEESAILQAKNVFVRRGVNQQLSVLRDVRESVDRVGEDAEVQFKDVLRSLDAADSRLKATLDSLRRTVVDSSLGSVQALAAGTEDGTSKRTLHDFIDTSAYDKLQDEVRGHIDERNNIQDELSDTLDAFDSDLRAVALVLESAPSAHAPGEGNNMPNADALEITPTASLFRSMEDHATEMAQLLQGLVTHFDLCVNALKNTEGGGEAAREATEHTKDPPPANNVEESLYREHARPPMSEEERTDMLNVLEIDAQEVEDVVSEIRHRAGEMEIQFEQLSQHISSLRTTHSGLRATLKLLHKLGDAVPDHAYASQKFLSAWDELKAEMLAKTDSLDELRDWFENYTLSYRRLLDEMKRRQSVETRKRRIAEKAVAEIRRLHEDDERARERFVLDVGRYLPSDIAPNVGEKAVRWGICPVEAGNEGDVEEGRED